MPSSFPLPVSNASFGLPVKDTDIKSKWELLYIHFCVVTSADVIKLMLCDKYE